MNVFLLGMTVRLFGCNGRRRAASPALGLAVLRSPFGLGPPEETQQHRILNFVILIVDGKSSVILGEPIAARVQEKYIVRRL